MERVYKQRSVTVVNWARNPKVDGIVVEKGEHEIDGKARAYLVVDDGTSLWRVYESTDLRDSFKVAEEGDGISIEFLETVALKKAGQKLNRFRSSVWTVPKAE